MKTFKEFSDEMAYVGMGNEPEIPAAKPTLGISKQSFKNKLYKAITPFTQGFFSDSGWSNVTKVFDVFRTMGVNYTITDNHYDGDFPHKSKTWKFEIEFINQRGKPDKIYGYLVAAGAGSVKDPLDRYDITVVMN